MSSVGLAPAELAGLVLESCLTGIALLMFFAAIYVLAYKRGLSSRVSTRPFNKVLFLATILLLLSVLAHWITNVVRAFDAFVYHAPDPGPAYIYGDLADPKNLVKSGINLFEIILADCILTYRLYVVWGNNKRVILFPCCTTIGTIVTGITITYVFSTLTPQTDVFASVNGRWVITCLTFTLCTNLYATPMIAYHIWNTTRPARSLGVTTLSLTIQVVLESAVIYTIATLSTCILYLVRSNAQFPTLDSISPIIGIVFCLIIVHAELGLASGQSREDTSISDDHHPSVLGHFPGRSDGNTNNTRNSHLSLRELDDGFDKFLPLRSLAAHITREADVHRASNEREDQKDIGLADSPDLHADSIRSDTQYS